MLQIPPAGYRKSLDVAVEAIAKKIDIEPRVGLILGSGLGGFAETLVDSIAIRYEEIPGWPSSTVEGHAGQLFVGMHGETPVATMQGRAHLYEGYEPWETVFPVRVLSLLGCSSLVVTNAAGAINRDFAAGELMLITDHINLQGTNACLGANIDDFDNRFFDMTYSYDPEYLDLARNVARGQGVNLREGVYAGVLGPSYETPAEISMLETIGADAVGMSTVQEVIAAKQAGLRVVGISCLSNMAAGVSDAPLDHKEVMEAGERVRETFIALVDDLVSRIVLSEAS
jgi:purine-nucleoside phosphorylase